MEINTYFMEINTYFMEINTYFMDKKTSSEMKLCLFKVGKLDVCIRPALFANLVTY